MIDKQYYYKNIKEQVIPDVYFYDVKACMPNILKSLGYDELYNELISLSKEERNIKIGYMFKYNKQLSKICNTMIINIIDNFLNKYNIKNEDIIFIQKDGLIIKKFINSTNKYNIIEPNFIDSYHYIIFGNKPDTYIAKPKQQKEIIIKGFSDVPLGFKKFINEQFNIVNISNLKSVNKILIDYIFSTNIDHFLIPVQNTDKYKLHMINGDIITISSTIKDKLNMTDLFNEIDKVYYFDIYFEHIIRAIIKYNLKE